MSQRRVTRRFRSAGGWRQQVLPVTACPSGPFCGLASSWLVAISVLRRPHRPLVINPGV